MLPIEPGGAQLSFSVRLHPRVRPVEVSRHARACPCVGWRCVWVMEGSCGWQIRVFACYKAIMAADGKVQAPVAGRVKVETSILYPGFDVDDYKRVET